MSDPSYVEALAERIPDCRLETIPVGHRVHSTAPEQFTATLLAFLAAAPPSPLSH